MVSNFNILVKKLDKFIKRYYYNLIIQGIIYFFAGAGVLFLTYILLEYFGYFSSIIRGILFYSFLFISAFIIVRFIIIPLLRLYRIGKCIDDEQAAKIIGNHFKGVVDDKIVNVIQLSKFLEKNKSNIDLLLAGINQKSSKLIDVKFESVIRYKDNLKYISWAVIPVIIITGMLIINPFIVVEPAGRIIKYDTYFERPAPFNIIIENPSLKAFQNEDFKLDIRIEGAVFPEKVEIGFDQVRYLTQKEAKNKYSYNFTNVQRSVNFKILAGGFVFGPYELVVVPRPVINNFVIDVTSPEYTGIEQKSFQNYGDLNIAEGSSINMKFNTRFAETVVLEINDDKNILEEKGPGIFDFNIEVYEGFKYSVYTGNEYTDEGDSLEYNINIIKDQYPEIFVNSHQDSVLLSHIFFTGQVRDDYGFDKLTFNYRVSDIKEDYNYNDFYSIDIPIDKKATNQTFTHHFDLKASNIKPGHTVEYFFSVWDNDQVNGPKKTTSRKFSYHVPGKDEIARQAMQEYQEIGEELTQSAAEISKTRDEIEELRKQLLDKEQLGWEDKEVFKSLLDKHEDMQNRLEELAEKKKKSETRYEQFNERSEKMKSMQEEMQRIFDEALSDELKELFEKISLELDKMGRDEMYEHLEKMDFEMSHFENQLERVLEIFKMMEFQNMLKESLESIDRITEDQSELFDKISETQEIVESDTERQKSLSQDFENLSDLLDELGKKNENLNSPQNIPDTRDVQHNIDYDLSKALEMLMNNDIENTLDQQQRSLDGLDQLSEMLKNFQNSLFQQELAEDARLLRQLLQNLLKTSFNQEKLMKQVQNININDPRYVEKIQEQRKIYDDLKIIEDSLIALSKRQIHVRSFINREIAEINMNIEKAIPDLINRRRNVAARRQQFVMTHVNNLALMLNESLQNMQMEMAMQQGFGDPQQIGVGEPSLQDIIDMQEQANEMLESIRQGHQQESGETGEQMSLSEQLARMSLQQEQIRNELRKVTEKLAKELNISTRELDQIQRDMERTEMDIVRNRINRQTMIRQDRILSRLLEHDRALMEREFEDERVGNVPEFYELSNPEDFFEYNRVRNQQIEMLRKNQIHFNRYYNNLVEQYFIKFN